jgi:cation diffusion facilitator family transporter
MDFMSGKTCTKIGLVGNIILTILKFFAGIVGRSPAMVADAVHSLSDVVATAVVYISLKISSKPPDKKHPFGHGHAETLAAFFVGLTLFGTSIYIVFEAVHALRNAEYSEPGRLALYGAIVSIVVKEIMFRYTLHVGKKIKSTAIVANAWDHRSDAYSSLAALIGIGGAILGYPFLDPISCLVIAGFIAKMSIEIFIENINLVMDVVPEEEARELEKEISEIISRDKNILNCSMVRLRPVGAGRYHAGIIINVPAGLSVKKGHAIAENLRKKLLKKYSEELIDILVQVAPGKGYKGFAYKQVPEDIESKINNIVDNHPDAKNMHDLNIYHLNENILITIDIEVDTSSSIVEAHNVAKNIKDEIMQLDNVDSVVVHIDYEGSDDLIYSSS